MPNEVNLTIKFTEDGAGAVITAINGIEQAQKKAGKTSKDLNDSYVLGRRDINQMAGALGVVSASVKDLTGGQRILISAAQDMGYNFQQLTASGVKTGAALQSMLAGGLIVAGIQGISYAVNAMQKDMADALKIWDEVDATWNRISTAKAKANLKSLTDEYNKGHISLDEYLKKSKELQSHLATADIDLKIQKTKNELRALNETLTEGSFADGAFSARVTYLWDKAFGGTTSKVKALADSLRALEQEKKTVADIATGEAEQAARDKALENHRRYREALRKIDDEHYEKQHAKLLSAIEAERQGRISLLAAQYANDHAAKIKGLEGYDERLAARRTYLDNYVLEGQAAMQRELRLLALYQRAGIINEAEHQKAVLKIKSAAALQAASTVVGQGAETFKALAQQNKAFIGMYKGFAVADVTIKSIQAIWKGYSELGPILGSVMGVLIAAKAAADIHTITSTSEAGLGGAGSAGGIAVPSGGMSYPSAQPSTEQRQAPAQNIYYIYGSIWARDEIARELAPHIKNAVQDGVQFGLSPA